MQACITGVLIPGIASFTRALLTSCPVACSAVLPSTESDGSCCLNKLTYAHITTGFHLTRKNKMKQWSIGLSYYQLRIIRNRHICDSMLCVYIIQLEHNEQYVQRCKPVSSLNSLGANQNNVPHPIGGMGTCNTLL